MPLENNEPNDFLKHFVSNKRKKVTVKADHIFIDGEFKSWMILKTYRIFLEMKKKNQRRKLSNWRCKVRNVCCYYRIQVPLKKISYIFFNKPYSAVNLKMMFYEGEKMSKIRSNVNVWFVWISKWFDVKNNLCEK